jgi:hypothetical protein
MSSSVIGKCIFENNSMFGERCSGLAMKAAALFKEEKNKDS